jgi:hypothetical protein
MILSVALLNDDFGSNFDRVKSATQLPMNGFSAGAAVCRELACKGAVKTTATAAANNVPHNMATSFERTGIRGLDTTG